MRHQAQIEGNRRQVTYRAAINLLLSIACGWITLAATGAQNNSFSITGRIYLPNNTAAAGVVVKLTKIQGGFTREVFTDDQGRYEFRNLLGGSYRLTATNPADSNQFVDPVETDTSRAGTMSVSVNLDLRVESLGAKDESKKGLLTIAEATQKVPKSARKSYEQGLKLKRAKQLDQALQSFTQAVELYPEYFQAMVERGDIYVAQSRIVEAAKDFDQAIKIDGNHERALRGAGYCKLEQRRFAEAISYLERAIAVDPLNAASYLLLGIASFELDQREQAEQALQQALKINPAGAIRAHIHLANLYARERRYEEAAAELEKYLMANPATPEADKLRAAQAQMRAHAPARQ